MEGGLKKGITSQVGRYESEYKMHHNHGKLSYKPYIKTISESFVSTKSW